jgi:hypothetical protein
VSRQTATLVLILLIQCAMVGVLYWPDSAFIEANTADALIPFGPDRIDEIHIEDSSGDEAVLLKMSGQWILPDLAGIPVDLTMVDKLITSIAQTPGKWPVATTAASRQRFQVAAYHYQRRITLIGYGELLATIYLGTAPGFKKVHARNDTQDAIYSIEFNNYEAPTQSSDWLDKALIQTTEPLRISTAEYTLTKEQDGWVSATSNSPHERELAALLSGLANIRINGIADDSVRASLDIAAPETSFNVKTATGNTTVSLFRLGQQRFVRSSEFEHFFTLSAYDFDRLSGIFAPALNGTVSPDDFAR